MAESVVGAELFADWIEAGAPTYRDFAALLAKRGRYKCGTTAFSCVGRIATRDKWQDQKREALTLAAESRLEEAAQIDAEAFLITSRKLRKRLDYTDPLNLDALITIRESVRSKSRRTADVNVNVTVSIYQQAQRLAERLGISAEELIADAEKIAAEAWNG